MHKEIDNNRCDNSNSDESIIDKVRSQMIKEETLYDLAEFFKVFGDSTRIKILNALFISEMCVYHIADLLGMTQSAVSHQLKFLRQNRLVKFRREGKTVYYSLDDEHIKEIFDTGLSHITEEK